MVALVDDEDYERLAAFRWSQKKGRRGAWYAQRMINVGGRTVCREMQREIMDADMTIPGRSMFVDHINHDPLDNRRSNLRWVTPHESVLNRRRFLSNTLGYHGIQVMNDGLYRAHLSSKGRRYIDYQHLTAESAAWAYNKLAREHHGELALLNEVDKSQVTFSPKARGILEYACNACTFVGHAVALNRRAYFAYRLDGRIKMVWTRELHVRHGYDEIVRLHGEACGAELDFTIIPEEPK